MKEGTLTTQKVLEAISTEGSQELFNLIAEDKNSYDVVESGINDTQVILSKTW